MIACVDVYYRQDSAVAACVLFEHWTDAVSAAQLVEAIPSIEPYEPGQFYRRELPCLLAVLESVNQPLGTVVIDGYVRLGEDRPGLGAHLYQALQQDVPVLGVAKTRFLSASLVREVHRGDSKRPLYVTAAGMELDQAAACVAAMHGPHRLPTLLKLVDRFCREAGIDNSA